MRPALTDKERKHRRATSMAMKSHAEALRCPGCGRGSALKRFDLDQWTGSVFRCRYCKYEITYAPHFATSLKST